MANLITNGTFTTNLDGWTISPSGMASQVSGEARIIGQGGSADQFYQNGFTITSGVAYRLTVTARGEVSGKKLRAQVVKHSDQATLGLNSDITVTTSNATYELNFTATATSSDARLRFRTNGSTDTFYIDNVVLDVAGALAANFTGTPLSGNAPLSVAFTDTSTGTPTSWLWQYSLNGGTWTNFTSSTSQNPTQNFTASGVYGIRLTATNGGGSHTTTKASYINAAALITAGFTGTPLSGAITLTTTFTDSSTATNGITGRTWYYNRNGAGWVQFSTSTNPVFGFTQGGTYDIRLVVVGPDGTNTLDRLAYVTATGGVIAGFTGTTLSGAAPLSVTFTNTSTGTITGRTWEYSRNGLAWVEFSTATSPVYSFVQPGTYSIRLTVSSSAATDTLTRTSYVSVTGTDNLVLWIIDDAGGLHPLSASYAFAAETDYFLTSTYDTATGLAILFVNGAEIASSSVGSFNLYDSSTIYVGGYVGAYQSNALIDDLFFINRALPADEIRAVYESNAPVFAETSTWHWRAGRNRLWADAEGLWMVNASGTKVLGAYAGDENDPLATKTWGGVNLAESDVLIGDASRGGYLKWDDSAATLAVSGQIVILAGSTGYTAITDRPTTLTEISAAEATKLAGIAPGATVGATWGTNINSIPTRFGDAPGASGLYLTSTHLGYYNGTAWKAWIASNGFFYFGGNSGAHLEWNGTKLRGLGTDGTTEQWYANSTDGKIYAGAGSVVLDNSGISVIGETFLRLMQDASTTKGYVYSTNPLDSLLVSSTGIGLKTVGSAATESISLRAKTSTARSVEIVAEGGNSGTNRFRSYVYSGNASTSSEMVLSESGFSLAIGGTSADFSIDASGNIAAVGALDMNANSIIDVGALAVGKSAASFSLDVVGQSQFAPAAGGVGLRLVSPTNQTAQMIDISAADCGSAYGPFISVGRNSNASTPSAAWLRMYRRDGSTGDLWVDASGNLRIGVATAVTNATDAGGTVVGTQTSSLDSKNVLGDTCTQEEAVGHILAAAKNALRRFKYKNGSYNNQEFDGVIVDYAPRYGMDRDEDHPAGRSLNTIQVINDLILSVQYLAQKVEALENV